MLFGMPRAVHALGADCLAGGRQVRRAKRQLERLQVVIEVTQAPRAGDRDHSLRARPEPSKRHLRRTTAEVTGELGQAVHQI